MGKETRRERERGRERERERERERGRLKKDSMAAFRSLKGCPQREQEALALCCAKEQTETNG